MQAEIDGKLLADIRRLAKAQDRSERELLIEAVRSYLERSDPRRFEELLERMSSQLHAIRAEKAAKGSAW